MAKKLLSIAVLPFSKAQILKTLLEKEKVPCELEDLNLPEGTSSMAVRIHILEDDLERAFPVLEEFLGKPARDLIPGKETERQILVPIDFSGYSLKAAIIAFNIARHIQAKMVLFHSYPNPIIYSVPFSDIYAYDTGLTIHLENSEKTAQSSMEEFLKTLVRHLTNEQWKQVDTEYIIKAGDARDDILMYAHKNQVKIIVMGTRGKAGSEYDILGSVTAEIINSARVPVLAIPEATPDTIAGNFRKILYSTNFDDRDFIAIDELMRIMESYNVEIHCVHVGKSEEPVWNLAKLEGMKNILHAKYTNKTFFCHFLVGEDILQELEKFIRENQIDLLSLTSRKRGLIARIFNPSIARKMLFHTDIPLLVFSA